MKLYYNKNLKRYLKETVLIYDGGSGANNYLISIYQNSYVAKHSFFTTDPKKTRWEGEGKGVISKRFLHDTREIETE